MHDEHCNIQVTIQLFPQIKNSNLQPIKLKEQ